MAQSPCNTEAGSNVVLYGPVGSGKDHLLCVLGHEAIIRHEMRVEWVNAQKIFQNVRDGFTKNNTETDVLKPLVRAQILIIADPFTSLTDFQAGLLYRLIDERYRNCRPTWTSINAKSGDDAEQSIGPATVDRLRHGALSLRCNWPSFRQRNSD